MELVNKQKVEALFNPALTGKTTYTADEILLALQTMPTVDAIPVEWLKKKYEEADDLGMGIEDWSEKDCFGHVIKEWEKENGRSK